MRAPRPLLHALVVAALGAAASAAQLDLPRKKGAPDRTPPQENRSASRRAPRAGDLVPHLTCTVCLTANYTTPIDTDSEHGLQTAWCGVCRTPRLHRLPEGAPGSDGGRKPAGGLDLPETVASPPSSDAGSHRDATARGDSTAPRPATGDTRAANTSERYFDAVARVHHIDDGVALRALENLVLIGEPARRAARFALVSEHAPTAMLAIRVLLRSPEAADHDLVLERLRHRLPSQVAPVALDELATLDPVRATPALFAAQLAHAQAQVRASAHKLLAGRLAAEHIPLLEPLLGERLVDARLRALDLVSRLDDPRVLDLVLARVDDASARVAGRAIDLLAKRSEPEVEQRLLATAFEGAWILRRNAYAILALIERETVRLEPILSAAHLPELLSGLESLDPFVAGTCAAALAGIGFRSGRPDPTDWLDRAVPDRLVATVAGHVFFSDFSALQGPALRALEAISGVRFGADGPAWARWWVEAREGFRASRASIALAPGDEASLAVAYRAGGGNAAAFQLLAPAAEDEGELRPGETVYLTEAEALEFVELCAREGITGAEVLPGQRGMLAGEGRWLEIRIAGQQKSFGFGSDASEPWFERATGMARALRERNRWQRFPEPGVHQDRRGLWLAESSWWAHEQDELVRARRLERLVVARARAVEAGERTPCIAELERLAQAPDGLTPEHFTTYVELLDQERYFGDRARRLLGVAEHAGGLAGPTSSDGTPSDELARGRIEPLLDVLARRFASDAFEPLVRLLARAGPERAREAARDSRDVLRAASAPVLARSGSETDVEVLHGLLRDSSEAVEIAAVMALGDQRLEAGRTELLVRARIGTPLVRAAALRAIGKLGGESVIDALSVALTDPDPELKLAAAEGLAAFDDPRTIPMLVTLLRQGRAAAWYAPVREGLRRRGRVAEDALRSMLNAPQLEVRREAALLLCEQGRYEVVPDLIRVLTEERGDSEVAGEIAVATCVDMRSQEDPARAWWDWWDEVRRDEPLAWFRAALEREGREAPPPEAFASEWDRGLVLLLLEVVRDGPEHLAERARRELGAHLERDLPALPPQGAERVAWVEAVEASALGSRQ